MEEETASKAKLTATIRPPCKYLGGKRVSNQMVREAGLRSREKRTGKGQAKRGEERKGKKRDEEREEEEAAARRGGEQERRERRERGEAVTLFVSNLMGGGESERGMRSSSDLSYEFGGQRPTDPSRCPLILSAAIALQEV